MYFRNATIIIDPASMSLGANITLFFQVKKMKNIDSSKPYQCKKKGQILTVCSWKLFIFRSADGLFL